MGDIWRPLNRVWSMIQRKMNNSTRVLLLLMFLSLFMLQSNYSMNNQYSIHSQRNKQFSLEQDSDIHLPFEKLPRLSDGVNKSNYHFLHKFKRRQFQKNIPVIPKPYIEAREIKPKPRTIGEESRLWIHPMWTRITVDLYVYSSFWEDREEIESSPLARTLGMWRYNRNFTVKKNGFLETGEVMSGAVNVSCYLWATDSSVPTLGHLKISFFEEKRSVFVGAFIMCIPPLNESLHSKRKGYYYAVSFLPYPSYPHKLIYFNSTQKMKHNLNDTAICVRPLFGPFSSIESLFQFINFYNAVLNIKTFYFYELSMTLRTKNLLLDFAKIGGLSIQILPWNLPTGLEDLYDLGTLTALNDCIYRTMQSHAFAITVDIDEFIVPKGKFTNMADLYQQVLDRKKGNPGDAILIRNVFFCQEFNLNSKKSSRAGIRNWEWPIFSHTIRENRIWAAMQRSKLLLVPSSVVSVGHHMVHRFASQHINKNLGASSLQVVMHHYRSCRNISHGVKSVGTPVLEQSVVKDVSILQYRKMFLSNPIFKDLAMKYL